MDTLTHAVVGIAIAGFSGHPLSFHDPIYLATIIGAQAPDFDILFQLRGRLSYLRQHRAFSHSLPGLGLWSALIAAVLSFCFPGNSLVFLFAWAYAGGLSHIAIDYLNTHGAALLWPFCLERKSMHLLNVFDPVLLLLLLSLYCFRLSVTELSIASLGIILMYVTLRLYLQRRANQSLREHFVEYKLVRMAVMPSLKRIFFWDFVLETEKSYFVGQLGVLYPSLEIRATLPRHSHPSPITVRAQKTPLGYFFKWFTPFVYFEEHGDRTALTVNIYDLRYLLNQQFLHRATITFDESYSPSTSYIHSHGQKIDVPC